MSNIQTILTNPPGEESFTDVFYWASRPGAFALYYDELGVVWLGYGKSISEGIGRALRLLDEGNLNLRFDPVYRLHGRAKLSIRVEFGEPRDAYINLWRQYKDQSYAIFSKSPSIWKVVEVPIRDPRPECYGLLLAVCYENQSGRRTLAGVFEKANKAREWVHKNLPNTNYILDPVYKRDNLTKEVRRLVEEWSDG